MYNIKGTLDLNSICQYEKKFKFPHFFYERLQILSWFFGVLVNLDELQIADFVQVMAHEFTKI